MRFSEALNLAKERRPEMRAKYTALDIANLYVQLANDIPNDSIDNLKLNKLCYYAQAWSLARLGYPLFDDAIEAWRYGPVVSVVYSAFKACGKRPIEEPTYHFDESRLTSEELTLLTDVYMTYGKYSSTGLIEKTHEAGSPWRQVYEADKNNLIDETLLSSYFSGSDELETMHLNVTPENVVEYE